VGGFASIRALCVLAATTWCVGCGGEEDGSGAGAAPTSGSRLRAVYALEQGSTEGLTAGGSPYAWHDLDLGIDCRFLRNADGAYRCLPVLEGGLPVFSTPTCGEGSGAIALSPGGSTWGAKDCSAGLVLSLTSPDPCSTNPFVLRLVGPAVSANTYGYVQTVSGECNPWSPGNGNMLCAAEPVDPSIFATAEASTHSVGSIRQVELRSGDGTREILRLTHPAIDASLREDRTGKFLEPELPQVYMDGSEACGLTTFCDGAVLVVEDECTLTPHRATAAGEANGSKCVKVGEALQRVPYSERHSGLERLQPLWVAHDGRSVLARGLFYDSALNARCRPDMQQDGTGKCIPEDYKPGEWFDVYTDAVCDTRVGSGYRSPCGLEPTLTPNAYFRFEPVGAPPSDPLFTGSPFDCQPLTKRPDVLYEMAPVTDGDLGRLTRVVDMP